MNTEFDVWVKYHEQKCKEMLLTFGKWYPRMLNTFDLSEAIDVKKAIDEHPQGSCVIESMIVCRPVGGWCECSVNKTLNRKDS